MEMDAKIYVAGHTGLLGSAILRLLKQKGYKNLIIRTRQELDLLNQADVKNFFKNQKPDYVILAAAKVGGIRANISYPADFIYENIVIQANVFHSALRNKVKKVMFFGSACSYPRQSLQPIKEEYLLTGSLEPTNQAYALAKIAGIEMCKVYRAQYGINFICGIPANIYGLNDNFDLKNSHVISALIRRFHEAKINNIPSVSVWGSGRQRREFIYAGDVAGACLFLMDTYNESDIVNIGTGRDVDIRTLSYIIKETVGYKGEVTFDTSKPDGMPSKFLDISKMSNLGWRSTTNLEEGIQKTYQWYLNHSDKVF